MAGRSGMSRRRPPKAESSVPDAIHVSIVCTGRGNHPEVDFGTLVVLPSGNTSERLKVGEHFSGIDLDAGKTLKTIPFVCRRCRPARNVPLKRETLDHLCKGLAQSDTPTLDLSALGAVGPISL